MRVRVALTSATTAAAIVPEHFSREAVAHAGEPVSIGSGPAATLCVPDDPALAPVHALVTCYDDAARVYDLAGSGVQLSGVRAHEVRIPAGGGVLALGAHTTVQLDAWSADVRPPATGDPLPPECAAVLAVLRGAPDPLYAVLDAARGGAGLGCAQRSGEPMAAVPDDVAALDYADAAPYLIRLAPESPLLDELLRVSWGRAECAFLTSPRPFAELRAALRDLMDAELEGGERVLFRFYDPLVLDRVLSASGVDAAPFFGPVSAWFVESGPDHATLDGGEDGADAAPAASACVVEYRAAADAPSPADGTCRLGVVRRAHALAGAAR